MKQVVIICYPNDWHWVLSAEFINSVKEDADSLEVWDFSWAGENVLKRCSQRLFLRDKLQQKLMRWLLQQKIPIISDKSISKSKKYAKFECNNLISNHPYLDLTSHRTIFNTVVEEVGNLKVDTRKHSKEIYKQVHASFVVKKLLERYDEQNISRAITVNGRFTKNATVRDWAQSKNLPLVLLEFGHTREFFEEFNISPHSVSEVTSKMYTYWNNANEDFRKNKALKYLNCLLKDEISEIKWRGKMKNSELPLFPKDKKICVFFSSTESEEAGLGDPIKEGNFKSQVEAFSTLLKILPKQEWHIFIRRHPKDPLNKSGQDPEQHLWNDFGGIANVSIIDPESPIDSIALGLSADLVANYWSTIAIELLARGKSAVITLGDAPWNQMVPTNSTRTANEIAEFLAKPLMQINVEKLYPWAFYYSSFGKHFQVFKFDRKLAKWVFKNSK